MNAPILNRDFQHPADGWYHLEAKGNHPNRAAGIVQVIDDKACESIVNRFNAVADKPGFTGMLIDHEHFKHDQDKTTEAYGWLMRLQNRADGYYGQIRWTGTGQPKVDDGTYRFFSTEYDPADLEILNCKKPRQVRPLRLDGITLTNANNNKGQKPITNRMPMKRTVDELADAILAASEETGGTVKNRADASALAEKILNGDYPGHPFHGNQYAEGASGRSQTNRASGAAHEATRDAMESGSKSDHEHASAMHKHAAAAANKAGNKSLALYHDSMANMHGGMAKGLKNRFPTGSAGTEHQQQTSDLDMKTVIAELKLPADASETDVLAAVKKITNRVTELETAVIDADLETYQDRFDPKQKEFIRTALVTNRAGTIDFLKTQPQTKRPVAPGLVHNRAAAGAVDHAVGGDEETLSAKRNEAIENHKVTNRCTYETAYNAVRRKSPELFGITSKK